MSRSSATPLLWLALLPGLLLPLDPNRSGGARSAIDTSEPGVVCDTAEQLCYDSQGLSLPATRRSFGRYGEGKARRLIDRGERGRTFLLSNGVACDVGVRTCWDDGWKRRNVSLSLSRHLFAGRPASNWNSDNWNTNWNHSTDASGYGFDSGACRLRRGGRTLYQGDCELRQAGSGRNGSVEVILRNGARYTLRRERGRLWIRDDRGRSWPAEHADLGRGVVFRWEDMSLEARPRNTRDHSRSNDWSRKDRLRSVEPVLQQRLNGAVRASGAAAAG